MSYNLEQKCGHDQNTIFREFLPQKSTFFQEIKIFTCKLLNTAYYDAAFEFY